MTGFLQSIVSAPAVRALVAGAAVWLAGVGVAAAESRVALVIGNGGYQHVPALPNPPNDAHDVAQALQALGFKVTLLLDADHAHFQAAVAEFGRDASKADVSMFYYGGHGVQVDSHNYLLPVDADLHKVADIEKESVALDNVIDAQRRGAGLHLVFLDACREDPTRNSTGLARPDTDAPGFYFVYATSPNKVALDGAGAHSPFARALLDHIAAEGVELTSMIIDVRQDVLAATGGGQTPWDDSSLTKRFYFAGAAGDKTTPETALWRLAGEQRDKDLLALYLAHYPKGPHANDVRALLPAQGDVIAPPPPKKNDDAVEDDLWKLTLSSRERSLVNLYLARYPGGSHAKDAAALLSSLQTAEVAAGDPAGVCERLATHPSDATASAPGVDLQTLADHAPQAVDACGEAVREHPENPHFLALLARATFAAGRPTDSVALYRKAAAAGDTRAMVSLATLMENGSHTPKDLRGAYALYEKAMARNSPDAAINLGVALFNGIGVQRNVPRALVLFRKASELGSARATFNLAKLVSDGVSAEKPADSLDLFKKAADLGYPGAYRAAALLLDVGKIVPRDVNGAADEILECVRADFGDCLSELTGRTQIWSPDSVRALQLRLKAAGYYAGQIDGKSGPSLTPALNQWRLLGPPKKA